MPEWKAKFETSIDAGRGEFATKFMNNIKSNFEGRLSIPKDGKTVAVAYRINGDKASGYRLTASVTYESKSEFYPPLIGISKRWKAVYDEEEWHKRLRRQARRMAEKQYGREKAEELFPSEADEEE